MGPLLTLTPQFTGAQRSGAPEWNCLVMCCSHSLNYSTSMSNYGVQQHRNEMNVELFLALTNQLPNISQIGTGI